MLADGLTLLAPPGDVAVSVPLKKPISNLPLVISMGA